MTPSRWVGSSSPARKPEGQPEGKKLGAHPLEGARPANEAPPPNRGDAHVERLAALKRTVIPAFFAARSAHGQKVTRMPSERLKPAPPAAVLRYQNWKKRTSPAWMPAYGVLPKFCA